MKIAMSSGHGKYIRGASGSPIPPELDEVDQARIVVDRSAEILNAMDGVTCVTFHDNISDDQSENLNRITDWHNEQVRDYDVSVHFNAYDGSAHGVEVLYVTQQSLASKISGAIASAGAFTNRGAKKRTDLHFLNATEQPAVLIETCFCDNTPDCNKYNATLEAICVAIAEELSGQEVTDQPPVEEVPPPDQGESGENRVEILGKVTGDVAVIINGSQIVKGSPRCRNMVRMRITMHGDVVVTINGQDFHNKPPTEEQPPATGPAANHAEIETTVFGGASDPNNSAYPPYGYLNDSDLYVALPYSFPNSMFPNSPPRVRVYCGELSAVGEVRDKGPWTTDDEAYVMGTARPIAETCHDMGAPLPSGPNAGKVPSNRAGLDLSPALASKVGLQGKGLCNWEFVEDEVA